MPDPILPGRIGLYLSMLQYSVTGNRGFAREHAAFFEQLRDDEGPIRGKRALDIGCGKSCWLTLLLAADGAGAIGVDTEFVSAKRGIGKYRDIWRENGGERALRTWAWDMLFARGYYRELMRTTGLRLPYDRVELKGYDGMHFPLPDASVDLAVSHEVFEHVADVPALLQDLRRVLKPRGRIYIYVHHFTSLSGGHHIAWKHPDIRPSRKVAPWDHLRARKHIEIPSWLNGLREHEYRAMFEQYFEIDEWRGLPEEGRALLTPQIRQELQHYGERELLIKGFLVRGRPKPSPIHNDKDNSET